MKKPDLNNPDTATDLPKDKRDLIKQMQADFKAFNEQQKLYDKLNGNVYDGYVHPLLFNAFKGLRNLAKAEQFGGVKPYFKLMRIASLEGLNYNEIAQVFNFIESCSVQNYIDTVGHTVQAEECIAEFLDIFEKTYDESAMNVWNKQVDIWREEIGVEKQEMVNKINSMVDELNADIAMVNKSRKERKKANELKIASKN